MNQADLIWMNGEFVAFEDAKVHVLTHALHYGTGVFEGVRAYETPRGTAIFRHRTTSTGCSGRPRCTSWRSRTRGRDPPGDARADPPQRLQVLLHPPARLPRRRADGPVPAQLARRGRDRRLGVGRLPRRRGQAHGVRAKVSSWRRHPPDSLIPAAKASGQYLNSVLAKIEADKAGYEEGILLDQHGYVCEGTGENLFVVKDGMIATPGFQTSILGGINRVSRSRSSATSATRSSSATSPAASSTWPTRSS